jgi:hypothetical protein
MDSIQDSSNQSCNVNLGGNDEVLDSFEELILEGQGSTLQSTDLSFCPLTNSIMTEEDITAVEDILDQLIEGNFTDGGNKDIEKSFNDSGYTSSIQQSFDLDNISDLVLEEQENIVFTLPLSTEDGEQVITVDATSSSTLNGSEEVLLTLNFPSFDQSQYVPDIKIFEEDETNCSEKDLDCLHD